MKIQTRHFGELEIPEDIILTFDDGIPGFPESKKFILIAEPEEEGKAGEGLFYWLQSVDEPEIALVLMDVGKVMPEYDPHVEVDELEEALGSIETSDLFVYNVVVIPEQPEKMSVNLKAPIIINDTLKKGKQIISKDEDYPIRYYIYEELKKNGR